MAASNSKLKQRLFVCCFILAGCVWIFACLDAGMLVFRVWHGTSKQLAVAASDNNLPYKIAVKAQLLAKVPTVAHRQGHQQQQQQHQHQPAGVTNGTTGPKPSAGQQQQPRAVEAT
jgi:hypothetical protein